MVPQEFVSWLIAQPPQVLGMRPVEVGRFALDYLVPAMDTSHDAAMMDIIRKDLTRNLGNLQPDLFHDMRQSIDSVFGLECGNNSWQEVGLFDSMQKVIFRSVNRVFVGMPLGHDQAYIRWSGAFAVWIGAGAIVVGQLTPPFLKPLLGYAMAIPIYVARRVSMSYLIPVFRQRLEDMQRKRKDPAYDFEEPKDMITWMVETVLDNPDTAIRQPEALASRLLFLVSSAYE